MEIFLNERFHSFFKRQFYTFLSYYDPPFSIALQVEKLVLLSDGHVSGHHNAESYLHNSFSTGRVP